MDLGAGPLRAFLEITLPIIAPALISAVSGEGVKELLRAAHAKVRARDKPLAGGEVAEPWAP